MVQHVHVRTIRYHHSHASWCSHWGGGTLSMMQSLWLRLPLMRWWYNQQDTVSVTTPDEVAISAWCSPCDYHWWGGGIISRIQSLWLPLMRWQYQHDAVPVTTTDEVAISAWCSPSTWCSLCDYHWWGGNINGMQSLWLPTCTNDVMGI